MSAPPADAARRIEIAGLSALELGPAHAPVELVFLHANGFHAALYAPLLAELAVTRRVLAPDLRGHGRTALPADPARLRNYRVFVTDMLGVLAALERDSPDPIVFAGHSLGANVALLTARQAPERVRALTLIEPVIQPSTTHFAMRAAPMRAHARRNVALPRATARRRARFASREEAFEAYKGRGAFRTWPDATLRDFVEEGLADAEDGGVVLRCDPAWEAAIYVALGDDIWGALRDVRAPLVVRAGASHSTLHARAERRLRRLRPDADVERIPGTTHFLPQERPDAALAAIDAALAATNRERSGRPNAQN